LKLSKQQIKDWTNLLPIEWRVQLNSNLIERQDLSIDEVAGVFAAHGKKLHIFNQGRELLQKAARKGKLSKKKQEQMHELNEALTTAEYQVQNAWGFSRDDSYHTWWTDLPGCTCPKRDNEELRGVDAKIINQNCPWHSIIYERN
jgi:hypothetical protein